MPDISVANRFGDLMYHPSVVVEAIAAGDIVAVFKDTAKDPAPVRTVCSKHSTAPCGVAEHGMLITIPFEPADPLAIASNPGPAARTRCDTTEGCLTTISVFCLL
jgi:hypothetical protein